MQAPPPFQITVERFALWRAVCAALAAVSVGALLGWAAQGGAPWSLPSVGWVGLGSLLSLAGLVEAWRMRSVSLRWDTERWHLGAASRRGNETQAGELKVMWDAGGLMLLRFRPESPGADDRRMTPPRPWADVWLPVQMRGHSTHWHALRCTVYCARLRATPGPAGGP
jgi:hypothetical protein